MAAKDKFHSQVREALEREGWVITHDPYYMQIGRKRSLIDLAAEMPIAAEKEGRKIAVEIKSFLGKSELDELENALGQYGVYHSVLRRREPERQLYLALPKKLRELLFDERDFQNICWTSRQN